MNTPVCTCEKPVLWCPDPPTCMTCELPLPTPQNTEKGDEMDALFGEYENDVQTKAKVRAFIKANFVSRKEVGELIEKMDEQNQITQAILDALEYRGFNDAGKYLDGSIWERVKPLLLQALLSPKEK